MSCLGQSDINLIMFESDNSYPCNKPTVNGQEHFYDWDRFKYNLFIYDQPTTSTKTDDFRT